ncbi:hypothetical protein JST97_16460 [bacterium]|nr:hypothetical protein [bacterium]
MSEFEVHLQFERGEARQRSHHDAFEGSLEELAQELPAQVQVNQAEPEVHDPTLASFQSAEERERAIEAAMRRLGERNEPRVTRQLAEMIQQGCSLEQLDELEVWLRQQLVGWQKRVSLPEGESPEAKEDRELAETFNLATSLACDGLNLALELVGMLRQGTPAQSLAEALLAQVNDSLQQARQFLLASEPYID